MNPRTALILLVVGAVAAPAAIIGAEWLRTVMGFLNLAPGTAYIPNGHEVFYLIVAVLGLGVAAPLARHRIAEGDFRLSKCVGNFLAIVIFWKVIDVTLFSDAPAEEIGGSGLAANLVLSIGTLAYAFLGAWVFWRIAIRPHKRPADSSAEGVSR